MSAHTPGPWKLCAKGDYGDFKGQSRVIVGDDRRIAVVHVSNDSEDEANATLFSAAADLLKALKVCHKQLRHWVGKGFTDCEPACEMARKAIAKAEGKE